MRKLKSRDVEESKSKSNRVHDSGGEKKEESNGGIKIESKRKYEKDLKGSKEEKECEVEDKVVDIGDDITPLVGFGEEQERRYNEETYVWSIQDDRSPKSEKELEKRRRKRDGSKEKNKYQDDVKGSVGKKYKYGNHGDRDMRYRYEMYADDVDREKRYIDAKYRERSEKNNRHKDDKYYEDFYGDKRRTDDKCRESSVREKHKDTKYREDADDYRRQPDNIMEIG